MEERVTQEKGRGGDEGQVRSGQVGKETEPKGEGAEGAAGGSLMHTTDGQAGKLSARTEVGKAG